MSAPIPNGQLLAADPFDRKAKALNRANDEVAKMQECIELLQRLQVDTLQGVTSNASRFWTEVRRYQLADKMSSLFGCDAFEDAMDASAEELWREHNYDIREETYVNDEGFPTNAWKVPA